MTALVVSLLLGGFSATAGATDQPGAPASSSPTTTAPRSAEAFGTIAANPDSFPQRTYSAKYYNVLANDKCSGVTPCTPARMTAPMAITGFPAGWSVSITSAGLVRVGVPGNIVAGSRAITYTITDASGTATGTLVVRAYLGTTPDHYNPRSGSTFSHAFVKGSSYRIRTNILRTINSSPPGSQIRILSWSFASKTLRTALVAAKRRGVAVQIIMSKPADPSQSDYGRLRKLFGGERFRKSKDHGSWVYACLASCRGSGGTMHAKVFLFSQSNNTRWVIMSGSGNMTDYAAQMQWNQQYTLSGNQPAFNALTNVFDQAKHDVYQAQRELTMTFPTTTYWMTPLQASTPQYDFILSALNKVSCTNSGSQSGRTVIRIGMYVWRDTRGDWMAHKIRQLWNAGCDIRIIYAIMGNRNKAILYSPSGRGRIPLRQTIEVDQDHRPVWYLHQKYIAIAGNINSQPKQYAVYQGSFNFSDLGMRSDENMQKIYGYANFVPYNNDFNQVWVQRQTRAPNPNSYVLQEERIGTGTGRYQFMEKD